MDPEINEKLREVRAALPRDFVRAPSMNIVERLREYCPCVFPCGENSCCGDKCQAADTIEALAEALNMLMAGCEHGTIMGFTGWHTKTMPTNKALDAARAALRRVEEKV